MLTLTFTVDDAENPAEVAYALFNKAHQLTCYAQCVFRGVIMRSRWDSDPDAVLGAWRTARLSGAGAAGGEKIVHVELEKSVLRAEERHRERQAKYPAPVPSEPRESPTGIDVHRLASVLHRMQGTALARGLSEFTRNVEDALAIVTRSPTPARQQVPSEPEPSQPPPHHAVNMAAFLSTHPALSGVESPRILEACVAWVRQRGVAECAPDNARRIDPQALADAYERELAQFPTSRVNAMKRALAAEEGRPIPRRGDPG